MADRSIGLLIVVGGVVLVIVGFLVLSGAADWVGRLPGDIRVERENVRFYFPLASMLVLSLIVTLLFALLRRWL